MNPAVWAKANETYRDLAERIIRDRRRAAEELGAQLKLGLVDDATAAATLQDAVDAFVHYSANLAAAVAIAQERPVLNPEEARHRAHVLATLSLRSGELAKHVAVLQLLADAVHPKGGRQ